jgi:maltose O-acetyltransferase
MDDDYHGIEDRHSPPPPKSIILEDNVWLGARVTILKGVTIGHDSVIGAGSVVTKSIPPRSVAVGVPASVIKTF